jgi:two-component system OmpR family sensor kinase
MPAQLDLQQLVSAGVTEMLPMASARRIDLGVAHAERILVRGQSEALAILLRNLLDNALKFTPDGGQIDVSVQFLGDVAGSGIAAAPCALLTVDDSGPGIAPAHRQRVFDRFFREPDAAAGGSGLGLAIVDAIARQHGAKVTLGTSALGGLRVEVRMPA